MESCLALAEEAEAWEFDFDIRSTKYLARLEVDLLLLLTSGPGTLNAVRRVAALCRPYSVDFLWEG